MPNQVNYIIRLTVQSGQQASFLLENLAESMKQAVQSTDYESQSPRYMEKQLLL